MPDIVVAVDELVQVVGGLGVVGVDVLKLCLLYTSFAPRLSGDEPRQQCELVVRSS